MLDHLPKSLCLYTGVEFQRNAERQKTQRKSRRVALIAFSANSTALRFVRHQQNAERVKKHYGSERGYHYLSDFLTENRIGVFGNHFWHSASANTRATKNMHLHRRLLDTTTSRLTIWRDVSRVTGPAPHRACSSPPHVRIYERHERSSCALA